MTTKTSKHIVEELIVEYDAAVSRLRTALASYLSNGTIPLDADRERRDFCYPALVVRYGGAERETRANLAFGRLEKTGTYTTTITRPALFADYLEEQLDLLLNQYEVEISVVRGDQEIPFPYVLEGSADLELGDASPSDIARYFPDDRTRADRR